ncbi:Calmodulin-binding [Phytophthora infestans]|uniref:Calmodulin-binding n=1 Tax=Phytophthora infestans TaxID=4787 RepID=A0A833S268_PHYIN|nr:Calmodulin-binding [Phytophthora infestans]
MQREECIYNLIPKVHVEPVKPERYRSKFDPNVQPTGTTFGVRGKTRLEGSNLGAAQKIEKPASARGFGRLPAKPDPKTFTRKGERSATAIVSKKPGKFNYPGTTRPPVVKKDDKPIMGLKSAKNFITANAVETILAVPGNRARVQNEPPQYKTKEDYGQVPRYLSQVKDEIERENSMIEEFVRQNHNLMEEDGRDRVEPMDESERRALVDALKSKWDHVNAKYQKLCHNVVFDTLGKVRRKETFEKELTQLEKDIQLLEKGRVVISQNQGRYGY